MAGSDSISKNASPLRRRKAPDDVDDNNSDTSLINLDKSSSTTKGPNDADSETVIVAVDDAPHWHHSRESLLSYKSGFNNYRGLLNLAIVLLFVANARLAVDNLRRYGVRMQPLKWILYFWTQPVAWPLIALTVLAFGFMLIGVFIEKLAIWKMVSRNHVRIAHFANITLQLVVPVGAVMWLHPNPAFSSLLLFVSSIFWMKMISWIEVNRDRATRKKPRRSNRHDQNANDTNMTLIHYPDNVSVGNMMYFIAAPTLCYELNFPRTPKIRVRFLIRRLCETLFLVGLLLALVEQWIVPAVENSLQPLTTNEIMPLFERILSLAIPNIILWLIFFFTFFHCFLNLTAEVMRFADRQFYRDYWNATTLTRFWTTWNVPVHRWCARHVYLPLVRFGYDRRHAAFVVFFGSALFHELLVSVPLQMWKSYFFLGMMGQLPMLFITDKFLKGNQYGNVLVWLTLIFGQPYLLLMYARDYAVERGFVTVGR